MAGLYRYNGTYQLNVQSVPPTVSTGNFAKWLAPQLREKYTFWTLRVVLSWSFYGLNNNVLHSGPYCTS